MSDHPEHFLLICDTCKSQAHAQDLSDRMSGTLPDGFAIRLVSCMAGCDHGQTVGFQAPDKAQYLFGKIETREDLDALASFARQYRDTPDGWTNATNRPRALFRKTLSRMPALPTGGPS